MKKIATFLLIVSACACPAYAQLRLTITQGVTDPIPIAVVPFARAVPADGGVDVAAIVQRDLESSGRFKGMPRTDMLTTPTTAAEVEAAAWKQMRNDYVVVGKLAALANGDVTVDAELINVLTGQRLLNRNGPSSPRTCAMPRTAWPTPSMNKSSVCAAHSPRVLLMCPSTANRRHSITSSSSPMPTARIRAASCSRTGR